MYLMTPLCPLAFETMRHLDNHHPLHAGLPVIRLGCMLSCVDSYLAVAFSGGRSKAR
jgi:hypothetical protein